VIDLLKHPRFKGCRFRLPKVRRRKADAPAALVLPLDPAADAELFALIAEWQRVGREFDAVTEGDPATKLCDRFSDLRDAINAIPARTVPGLRFKLVMAWAKRMESKALEDALIYGTALPPLPWDDEGKWTKPEYDPEWALIRSLAPLMGVPVQEEAPTDFSSDIAEARALLAALPADRRAAMMDRLRDMAAEEDKAATASEADDTLYALAFVMEEPLTAARNGLNALRLMEDQLPAECRDAYGFVAQAAQDALSRATRAWATLFDHAAATRAAAQGR